MTKRLGKPKFGESPRLLTATESGLCGIPRTRTIRVSEDGKVFFSKETAQNSKKIGMIELAKAEKKLEWYWEQPMKWRTQ